VFERFGKVLDIEENRNIGLTRSVFITFYHQNAVHRALTASFYFIFFFLNFLIFFFSSQHSVPIILNREALKILPWRAHEEPDSSDAEAAGGSRR
jgi:hypothetical protein